VKKVIQLIDFTGVCHLAMEHVALIAHHCNCEVTLLHIAAAGQEASQKEIEERIKEFARPLDKEGVNYSIAIDFGDFFTTISESIARQKADLMVVGTHGISGIKPNFVGSSILKLIQLIHIPALVVQGHSQTPHEGYIKILIPLLDKPENVDITMPLSNFGSVFNATIHFMVFHNVANEDRVTAKAKELASRIAKQGLTTEVETEKSNNPNGPYGKSIVEYADIEDAQLIGLVISHGGNEHYFDFADQENILLNRLGKPVLCF
jgi:nucleotide-binding universal stress UspA family protein